MTGSAPQATASFSKPGYAPGELMVLTIDHTDVDRSTVTVGGTVTDEQGNVSSPFSATCVIDDGVVQLTQQAGRTWTISSASRDRTVLTAIA